MADPKLITSPLSGPFTGGDITVDVQTIGSKTPSGPDSPEFRFQAQEIVGFMLDATRPCARLAASCHADTQLDVTACALSIAEDEAAGDWTHQHDRAIDVAVSEINGARHTLWGQRIEHERKLIDSSSAAGWVLQDKDQLNLGAGVGVVVRNFSLLSGPCDYLLFIDRKVAGVIEAKAVGVSLTGVSEQSERYMRELPAHLGRWAANRLVFGYESTGVETLFRDMRDPNSSSRNVFTFHRPEALLTTLQAGSSFRGRLAQPAPLAKQGLRECQVEALNGLDTSLAHGDRKALIQMIMGAGKTFTACTASYRFIKHAGAKRVLVLVDRNNLGRQTLREFQDFTPPDDGRKFTQLYNVQHLQSSRIDPDAKVVITTIQRLYAMLRGQELSVEDEDGSAFESGGDGGSPLTVAYNPRIPIDTFDVIITDECHRSIYGVWRQVLEYFDAHIIGLTATPSRHTLGYFNRNLVSEYPYERSVADGVNVGYEVFRIRTHRTENGGLIDADYQVPVRDRRTRRLTYEQLDQDLPYAATDLDRSVTNPNQILTVLETYLSIGGSHTTDDRRHRLRNEALDQTLELGKRDVNEALLDEVISGLAVCLRELLQPSR